MPAKIIVEEVQKDVTLMTNPEAEFVSLVRHGANRMPFRVVKTARKGGETSVTFAVHSILLPTGVKLENLASKEGRQWLSEARVDKAEAHDGYTKLEQTAMKSLDPGTLQMVNLGDGVLAVVGQLRKNASVEGALTVGDDVAKGLNLDSPLDAPVSTEISQAAMQALTPSFGQLLDMEIGSMMNVIYGTLQQTGADAKSRKAAIMKAVDAFKTFLGTGLDAIGTAKVERKTDEGGLEEMFKTPEEFAQAVTGVVGPMLKEFGDVLKKELVPTAPATTEAPKTETAAPATEKVETPDIATMISAAIDKALKPVTEKLDDLATKTEKIAAQPTTTAAATGDPEPAKKTETQETEKKSVFSGLLTGKAMSRSELRGAGAGAGA